MCKPSSWQFSLVSLLALVLLAGCPTPKQEVPEQITDTVATQSKGVSTVDYPSFSSDSAWQFIEKQVSFGPRIPGTPAHRQCKDLLVTILKGYADTVWLQNLRSTVYGKALEFHNIIASFNPEREQRVLLAAHWDSRPWADEEIDPARINKGVLGANDGASGVGILLEIARIASKANPTYGVDIVFFDGEDYGKSGDLSNYFIGSRYFAQNFPLKRPLYPILLDLVGDKNAEFRFEPRSMDANQKLVEKVWNYAQQAGHSRYFIREMGRPIEDDHIMLINAGINMINIVDADLVGNVGTNPERIYWHTAGDTMDNLGRPTLQAVGETLVRVLYEPQPVQN